MSSAAQLWGNGAIICMCAEFSGPRNNRTTGAFTETHSLCRISAEAWVRDVFAGECEVDSVNNFWFYCHTSIWYTSLYDWAALYTVASPLSSTSTTSSSS
eukprot:1948545-Rhodomonas_salina.1